MKKYFHALSMIAAVSLLLACGREPGTTTAPESVAEKPVTSPPARTAANPPGSGAETKNASIMLRPGQPKTGDCLKAIVSGKKGPLVFQWLVNGEEVSEQTGDSLCDDKLKRDDRVEVLLVDTEIRADATIGNSPPRIVEVSATTEQALRRGDIRVNAVTSDIDGDEVTLNYQWLVNGEEDLFSTTETLAADRYQKGDTIQVKITPHDGIEEGETYASEALAIPNAPPRITSKPPEKFETLEYIYQVEASDPDGQKLTYRLAEAPPGMTIGESGQVNWSLNGVAAGSYPVQITAEDPDGGKFTQKFTITLAKRSE